MRDVTLQDFYSRLSTYVSDGNCYTQVLVWIVGGGQTVLESRYCRFPEFDGELAMGAEAFVVGVWRNSFAIASIKALTRWSVVSSQGIVRDRQRSDDKQLGEAASNWLVIRVHP